MGGNVQAQQADSIILTSASTNGGLQLQENRGIISVTYSFIDGLLAGEENSPTPTGGDNDVNGNAEKQFAGL